VLLKNVKLPLYTTLKRAWNVGIAPFIPSWTRGGSDCAVSRFCRFTPEMSHESSVSIECADPTTLSCVDRTPAEIQPNTSQTQAQNVAIIQACTFLMPSIWLEKLSVCSLIYVNESFNTMQRRRTRARVYTHTHTHARTHARARVCAYIYIFFFFSFYMFSTKVEPFLYGIVTGFKSVTHRFDNFL
jgi:hypothetical protein